MKSVQATILSAADTSSQTGSAWDVNQIVSASFQPVFGDTTAAGTVKIQCSNDNPAPSGGYLNNTFVPTNWADIPNATSAITAGVGPVIVIPNMCFRYVRAVFTSSVAGGTTIQILATGLSV